MRLRNVLILGTIVLVLGTSAAAAYLTRPISVRLLGMTNVTMLDEVREALSQARGQHRSFVRFDLISPGGPALIAVEIAREIRDAYDRDGITVEINAVSLCASGCTLVLASGTPGHRFINPMTLFLVHPLQTGMGECVARPGELGTQEQKVIATYYSMLRDTYARMTGQPIEVVEDWLMCGHERVGRGMMAVDMHIADALSR